ncbi:dihydrodipicolinate reductase [Alkalispirochaeta americana]|uniref:4-hydroxy-tetrahydrodipicolinate reductase n=1 Tax=Alkalispirochaeta americana TaxID=159291 RepID=A0A1N6WR69_9SPIO|nr:4-hydroxy-tetrahydrodipicolinate reductase [Alkalispirochaeta americana]SIQ92532.1 dihydrodipicolinate reductase [Alkalispirochaeta americana]
MRIVIVGYGRMGREIEAISRERGHQILATVDPLAPGATAASLEQLPPLEPASTLENPVTVIEFALPPQIRENVAYYARHGWHGVIGTTGWDQEREEVLRPAREAGTGLVYGSNFSVGANLFFRLSRYAARLANKTGAYDSAVMELHHRQKQDSPSGTALTIAEGLLQETSCKNTIQPETLHRRIEQEELHVISGRVGFIPGTHTVYLDSVADTVELTHRARTRQGFALGAVQAAEWISSRQDVVPVDEFFNDLFQDQ